MFFFFFFYDTATTEIYTLSLHDALPIFVKFEIDPHRKHLMLNGLDDIGTTSLKKNKIDSFEEKSKAARPWRSEEHTSELQSQSNLVCRLLLEKKKKKKRKKQSDDTQKTL